MTSCRWVSLASAFFDLELSSGDHEEFKNHLPHCETCQREVHELETLSRVVQDGTAYTISPKLKSSIYRIPNRFERIDLLPTARALASVAALLLVISLGFSSRFAEWPVHWEPHQHGRIVLEEWDSEALEEPEAEITHWVMAGLSETRKR